MKRAITLLRRHLIAATVLAIVSPGATVRAQVQLQLRDQAQILIDDDNDDPFDAPQMQEPMFVLNEATFNGWAFGANRNAEVVRDKFDSLLALKTEGIERTCGITATQKKKLQLAGRGDIKRFFDLVEEKKRKYLNVPQAQNKIQEIVQEVRPFQVALGGDPFGEGSFFAKTLKTTLNGDQVARYEQAALDKKRFRYGAKVDLAVALLDQAVGFTEDQRQRLQKVLMEETLPPKKVSMYDSQVVLFQASHLPETKLKPLFDDTQWGLLKRRFDQAKGFEQIILTNDLLPPGAPGYKPIPPQGVLMAPRLPGRPRGGAPAVPAPPQGGLVAPAVPAIHAH